MITPLLIVARAVGIFGVAMGSAECAAGFIQHLNGALIGGIVSIAFGALTWSAADHGLR